VLVVSIVRVRVRAHAFFFRSSWVWKDATMVGPPPVLAGLVRYNPAGVNLAKWAASGVGIEQDFKKGSKGEGLLPCDAATAALVGGLRPYHGLAPAMSNVRRATTSIKDPLAGQKKNYAAPECAAMLAAAEALMVALGRSVADESFCVLRSLVEPQTLLRDTVEVMLGRGLGGRSSSGGGTERRRRRLGSGGAGAVPRSSLPPLVGLHLRLQENIALAHDVDWEIECVARLASQLADRHASGRRSHPAAAGHPDGLASVNNHTRSTLPAVVFAVATDSPSQLADIVARVRRTAEVCQGNLCTFVTLADVGTMGHVSNKETQGATSVVQLGSLN